MRWRTTRRLREAEREPEDQRHLGRSPGYTLRAWPSLPRSPNASPWSEPTISSVSVEVSAAVELAEQLIEHAVHVQDRVVVDVGVGGAELRALGVVGVLVHVHQVQVQEPPLVAVDAQELARRLDEVHVGSAEGHASDSRAGLRATRRGGSGGCRRRSPGGIRSSPRPSRCARCRRCGTRRRGRSRRAVFASSGEHVVEPRHARALRDRGPSTATPSSTSSTTTGSGGGEAHALRASRSRNGLVGRA